MDVFTRGQVYFPTESLLNRYESEVRQDIASPWEFIMGNIYGYNIMGISGGSHQVSDH